MFKVYTDSMYVYKNVEKYFIYFDKIGLSINEDKYSILSVSSGYKLLYNNVYAAEFVNIYNLLKALSKMIIEKYAEYNDSITLIHGSGIIVKSKVILFLGKRNSGKSTLAFLLSKQQENIQFFSDDIIIFNNKNMSVELFPIFPTIREDIFRNLKLQSDQYYNTESGRKYIIPITYKLEKQDTFEIQAFVFLAYVNRDGFLYINRNKIDDDVFVYFLNSIINEKSLFKIWRIFKQISDLYGFYTIKYNNTEDIINFIKTNGFA